MIDLMENYDVEGLLELYTLRDRLRDVYKEYEVLYEKKLEENENKRAKVLKKVMNRKFELLGLVLNNIEEYEVYLLEEEEEDLEEEAGVEEDRIDEALLYPNL